MHSYLELKNWLEQDLGSIDNLEQLTNHCAEFLQKITALNMQDQNFTTMVIIPLQNILTIYQDTALDQSAKAAAINKTLQEIFVSTFFTEHHYQKRKTALTKSDNYESEIVSRLKSPNPLITLDGVFALKNDPRNLEQTARAATLIYAASFIYAKLKRDQELINGKTLLTWTEHSPYFGRAVVPSDYGNHLHIAQQTSHVSVLVNGNVYALPILDYKNQVLTQEAIQTALEAILLDYKQNQCSISLGCITAGPRELCNQTRKQLEVIADNKPLLKSIDESLFIVCLDQEENGLIEREKQIKKLFNNFSNRWYGTTQIVIGASGEAGIISSYTRGDNVATVVPLIDTIVEIAHSTPVHNNTEGLTNAQLPLKLPLIVAEDQLAPLVNATRPYFHTQNSLYKLDTGITFFLKKGLQPNAALQLLIMLAARDIDPQKKLPIFMQALAVNDTESTGSSLDWTFVATHKINKFINAVAANNSSQAELFDLFKDATATYAKTIEETSTGWSPTFFLQKPEGKLYDELCNFFITIGNQFNGGYAGYLFRPARLPGTVDVLSSFHKLPSNITLLGRPSGTLEAVNQFGVHIAFSRSSTEFSWMPNVNSNINLIELDAALKKWINFIDKIANTSI